MKRIMVRYRVKPDRVDDNVALVRAVFAELERERPAGIRYLTCRLPDGVSFVHLASIETADGGNPLAALAAFQRFTAAIADRCDEPPVAAAIDVIGSYRFGDG